MPSRASSSQARSDARTPSTATAPGCNTRCKSSSSTAPAPTPEKEQGAAAEVARLKLALAQTARRVDATLSQVAAAHDFLRDAKVHQDAEASRLAEVLEVLSIENKKLQAAARNGWSQTWKLQANVRAYE